MGSKMKLRKIFLLLLLTLLFLGLSYATEVSDDTTTTVDTSMTDTNDEVVQSSNTPIKETKNIITDKSNTKEITKQHNESIKTESSETYIVNDFNTLHDALTSSTYTTVTINIQSNIKLTNNTNLNTAIKTLTINGNGKSINGNNQYQFLDIRSDSKVTLKNLKITNCNAKDGGAINNRGTLTIINSTLNNNQATSGGSIHNKGTCTITNSTLSNNNAIGTDWQEGGGEIYNTGNLSINNSTLNNNTSQNDGGAIFNYYGNITINNSTLNNNKATSGDFNSGGVIYNFLGDLTITNSTLNNNTAKRGGAIYNHKEKITILNTTLNNNYADVGGAIETYMGTLIITNSTLNDNYGIDGQIIANSKGTVTLTDTVLNYTIGEEVGLYNWKGTIAIYEYPTWIKLGYIGDVENGSTVKVVARLFCNDTTPLKYNWVNVTVNSNVYKVKSDGAGYIRLNFTANRYSTNKITVRYGGNSLYPASFIARTFDVKQPTWIKIASMSNVKYGSTVKLVARLFCNDTTPLKYKSVYVTVNDIVYKVKSNGAGYIRLNYTVDNYDVQKISFKFVGTRNYLASSNNTTFNVKQPTWIKHARIGKVEQGSTVKIVGRLLYNGTNALKYKKVKVTVNDEIYTLKTDGAGYYRLNYTTNTTGNITFTSSFVGNKLYLASSNSTTFTVVKSQEV